MAKTARQKKVVVTDVSHTEMERAFGVYASADAEEQSILAEMEKEIVALRQAKAPRLEELKAQKEESFEVIQSYATENRSTLFTKKKSIDTPYGTCGYRTGNPKLKTLKGITWNAVKMLLNAKFPQYIRTEIEIAKDMLLADRDKDGIAEIYAYAGVKVEQDETFYIETKRED